MNKDKIINFFMKNKILIIGLLIVIFILFLVFGKKNEDEDFSLSSIYDVYPSEVRELYKNIVSSNCNGDLIFDLELNSGKLYVDKLSDNNKLDYVFSYLSKKNKLSDSFNVDIVNEAYSLLFDSSFDFSGKINNYSHMGDIYSVSSYGIISRDDGECSESKITYISNLYGYSYSDELLSIDVNVGYVENGILYDLLGNKLGEYDGDDTKLQNLFVRNSYYRLNYVKHGSGYKLNSVEWNNRA